jgi:putative transposase
LRCDVHSGRRSAASLPKLVFCTAAQRRLCHKLAPNDAWIYHLTMEISGRRTLPHGIPQWINPKGEIYFITINCKERFRNQLARPEISGRLFETIRYRQENFMWWPYLFLLMPDHLNALLSFPRSGMRVKTVVTKWKEWTAEELGIVWQRDFFEHRLRHDESRREKADYILQNPVRKHLVKRPEKWSFVYFADGQRPAFEY